MHTGHNHTHHHGHSGPGLGSDTDGQTDARSDGDTGSDTDSDYDFDWDALGDHLEGQAEVRSGFIVEAAAWLGELAPRHADPGRDDANRDDANRDDAGRDDAGRDDAGRDDANRDDGNGNGARDRDNGDRDIGNGNGNNGNGDRSRDGGARRPYRILDIGAGPGVNAALFAHAFPGAEVVAVDGTPQLLERARARAVREGIDGRLDTREAQLPDDIEQLGSADLVWSSHVIHHLGDQQAALRRLARHAVRPGGLLAIAEGGLELRYLPRDFGIGRPGFQTRLEAVAEEWFTEMRGELPDHARTAEHWPALLEGAGLTPVGTRSFLTDLPAPLEHPAREQLRARLARTRERFADRLDAEDLRTLDTLLNPDSEAGIMRRADAFYLTATTVYAARRPY